MALQRATFFYEILDGALASATLTQGTTRIKDLTVQFKAYVNSQRLIGLLREVQQQQGTRPNAALAKTLVDEAATAIEAAK